MGGVNQAQPVVGVLALQGDVAEHLEAFERIGVSALPVRRPEELAAVDGLVLPGGESTTMTRLLENFELFEPLRQRLRDGMPAYGSCAGMVLLAGSVLDDRSDDRGGAGVRPLGALDVVVRRNAFGRQVDSFEADLEFAGIEGDPLHAVFIRAPVVEKAGSGVAVLAEVPERSSQDSAPGSGTGTIVAVRQGPVLATAFHPELVDGDDRVHRLFVRVIHESGAGETRDTTPARAETTED
ncbi:pyridoxal 5'-phosphate synthase glutaminase subunit PdxT [Actinopolyspora sp. BKK1]|uniref:pyridoxal 5'-phosphate synthase glutaminase subunit PdxT n=1 Tax=Actinopolyspora saharensis TaxID=995062 RepID=UPI0013F641DE|nr:pyridoxal 5'-phosphate synthase glutaminase subunit PdxT [Actinopolyspora sp. BKK2]NHE76765.1 pyridoxal 5'-phosphate synthase glutaminase subunit PdxT [Actinopolyspora sp. BKK1]